VRVNYSKTVEFTGSCAFPIKHFTVVINIIVYKLVVCHSSHWHPSLLEVTDSVKHTGLPHYGKSLAVQAPVKLNL